jgi:hypothetical protein
MRSEDEDKVSKNSDKITVMFVVVSVCVLVIVLAANLYVTLGSKRPPEIILGRAVSPPNSSAAPHSLLEDASATPTKAKPAQKGHNPVPAANGDVIDIPEDPQVGVEYYVTLYAPQMGSDAWKNYDVPVDHPTFVHPQDKKSYIRLNILRSKHFQSIDIAGSFKDTPFENQEIAAATLQPRQTVELAVPAMKVTVEVVEAVLVPDPDSSEANPWKVFHKLKLKIHCDAFPLKQHAK